jgi:hypothetical protein
MDDSVLWVVAFGVGALGFLLLAAAGLVAMYLNTGPRDRRDETPTEHPQAQAEQVPPADKSQSPPGNDARADESQSQLESPLGTPRTSGGFWAWVKAWIFALIHAGTVSVVLGGITFFEDLANASEEIQHTGTVTFPKQLLPGTLSGSTARQRLSQTSGGLLRDGHGRGGDQADEDNKEPADAEDDDQPNKAPSKTAAWEVIDVTDEAGKEPESPPL